MVKHWSTWWFKLIIILSCAVIYGFLNKITSSLIVPGAEVISFRPQLVIPVTISILMGPFYGGFVALSGNLFGDVMSGFGLQFWHWSIANFLIAFIPGMVRWIGIKEIKKINAFGIVLIFIVVGNIAGLFQGFMFHFAIIGGGTIKEILFSWYLPSLIANSYTLLFLMPAILILFKFLKLNVETRSMFFVMTFSLVLVLITSFIFFSVEYRNIFFGLSDSISVEDKQALLSSVVITNFRWIGLILLIVVAAGSIVGYYFSRKFMQPISNLVVASNKLKEGKFEDQAFQEVKDSKNEISNLIAVFNEMAHVIVEREKKLENTIRDLQLTIDSKKTDTLFNELTETDFFQNLTKKSEAIRKRRK